MARKNDILSIYSKEVEDIKAAGLFKGEVPIVSPQSAKVKLEDGRTVINMCANNYLGLGDNQRLIDAAKRTYDERGYGVASVRFICGTQDIHKQLEKKISGFLGTDDTILYSSCFDANGGLFETILTADDAVISDELNHASIIDGIRLCKAKRFRYKNNNMEDLEAKLKEADEAGARIKLIATDGVFSMDGIICNLKGVCDLADKYNALVMVDDSHAVGFVGKHGRGTAEHCGVEGRVDIITGTLGKALGGASGGYTTGRKEIIDLLRQRSRPYLFSNSLAPAIAGASIEMFNMLEESTALRDHLEEVTRQIIDQVIQEPKKLPQIRRFLNYFLPTTLKILNAYDRMDAVGISGENIDATKAKVEDMMGTIVKAFDKQLDSLFGAEAMDISTDITVMENLLAQEGLAGPERPKTSGERTTLEL